MLWVTIHLANAAKVERTDKLLLHSLKLGTALLNKFLFQSLQLKQLQVTDTLLRSLKTVSFMVGDLIACSNFQIVTSTKMLKTHLTLFSHQQSLAVLSKRNSLLMRQQVKSIQQLWLRSEDKVVQFLSQCMHVEIILKDNSGSTAVLI